MERRLAAILAADVVGYSRLMERDEAGTLVALESRRKDVLEPLYPIVRDARESHSVTFLTVWACLGLRGATT
jgi:hypothetical protein